MVVADKTKFDRWRVKLDLNLEGKHPERSRLESVREAWLNPDPVLDGRTPRSIIERERARLPEVVSAHDLIIDPDCPCCQTMGDLQGKTFWHLDGSGMDDEFAFDIYHHTRQEWDDELGRASIACKSAAMVKPSGGFP